MEAVLRLYPSASRAGCEGCVPWSELCGLIPRRLDRLSFLTIISILLICLGIFGLAKQNSSFFHFSHNCHIGAVLLQPDTFVILTFALPFATTSTMFHLRRAAVRVASAQPSKTLPYSRPNFCASRLQPSKSILSRTLHQSRTLLANEQTPESIENAQAESAETQASVSKKEQESTSSSDAVADAEIPSTSTQKTSESAVDALSESSGTTSEPLGTSEAQSTSPPEQAKDSISKAYEQAQSAASDVAQVVSGVASKAARTAGRAKDNVSRAAQSSLEPPAPTRILYVGNLFFELTEPQLEAEFAKIGPVSNVRLVKDREGRAKGFGYIEYARQEDADTAVDRMSQKVFHGRRMAVQYHNNAKQRQSPSSLLKTKNPPSDTLFIGNMSFDMSDKDLNDLFRDINNVLDVRVAIDRRTGQPRGFAHADFTDVESALKAKSFLEQKVVYGRRLRVDFSAAATNHNASRSQGE